MLIIDDASLFLVIEFLKKKVVEVILDMLKKFMIETE